MLKYNQSNMNLLLSILLWTIMFNGQCYGEFCAKISMTTYATLNLTSIHIFPALSSFHEICIKLVDEDNMDNFVCGDRGSRFLKLPYINKRLVEGTVIIYDHTFSPCTIAYNSTAHMYITSSSSSSLSSSKSILNYQISETNYCYGSLATDSLNLHLVYDDTIEDISTIHAIHFNVIDITDIHIDTISNTIHAENIEPASWFYTLTPLFQQSSGSVGGTFPGIAFHGYIEYVLTSASIRNERVHVSHWQTIPSTTNTTTTTTTTMDSSYTTSITTTTTTIDNENDVNTHPSLLSLSSSSSSSKQTISNTSTSSSDRIHVCIWGSNKLDGQKTIWLQQIQYMSPELFSFIWILTTDINNDGPHTIRYKLKQMMMMTMSADSSRSSSSNHSDYNSSNVILINSPFQEFSIALNILNEDPMDGTPPASQIWEGDMNKLYKYISDRLRQNAYNISTLTPSWVKQLYTYIQDLVTTYHCDLFVYGNNRGYGADVLIRDSAVALNIPTVIELLNLFPDEQMLPNYIIAPSKYAGSHHSVVNAINTISSQSTTNTDHNHHDDRVHSRYNYIPEVFIIPPAVDMNKFNITRVSTTSIYLHSDCHHSKQFSSHSHSPSHNCHNDYSTCATCSPRCFHIAFMARLAPEKNPGLFIQFAAVLLKEYYPYARFTMIGDGALKSRLMDLSDYLDISWAITFTGWADEQLPYILADVDIVINPSLRGWSETFCIANVEVMSMGIPLVTFAVGGIGEYVDDQINPMISTATLADTERLELGLDSPPVCTNKTNFIKDSQQIPIKSDAVDMNDYHDCDLDSVYHGLYTVTTNAVMVNIASPDVIAKAVMFLINHEDIRHNISEAGKRTTQSYFTISRQMNQYNTVYKYIFDSWKKTRLN